MHNFIKFFHMLSNSIVERILIVQYVLFAEISCQFCLFDSKSFMIPH